MTSVPKPLKFIRPHYERLVKFYDELYEGFFKRTLADFLSVLSMTMADPASLLTLGFLTEGTKKDFTSWGHGYCQ
jgi:26S proteasome regulatory subunit N1